MHKKACTQAKEKSVWQNKISERHLSLYMQVAALVKT